MANDGMTSLDILFLHLQLSHKSILIILGNLVPGFVAIGMELLNEDRPFCTLLAQLRIPASSRMLYVIAIFAPLAINLAMFTAQIGLNPNAISGLRLSDFIRLFLLNILLAPLWEEIGWRGFLFPTLSKRTGSGRAALLVGFIWASWHFALYYYILEVSLYSFLISFGTIVGIGVVLVTLYSGSGNRLLLPILFHTSWNASTNWVIGAESKYDLGPIILQTILVWLLAGTAWICYRRFNRPLSDIDRT